MTITQTEDASCLEKTEPRCTPEYIVRSSCWDWRLFGALFGLVGGIVVALIGSAFTATSWIAGIRGLGAYMQTLGTDFLLLTIPLLILGAHCLDLVEKKIAPDSDKTRL